MAQQKLELYCLSWHPRAAKALIPAKYGGVALSVVDVQWPTQNRSPEYLVMNPAGKARAPPGPPIGGSTPGCAGARGAAPRRPLGRRAARGKPAVQLPAAGITRLRPPGDGSACLSGANRRLRRCRWQIPVLKTPAGCIFESNAIARYGAPPPRPPATALLGAPAPAHAPPLAPPPPQWPSWAGTWRCTR